LELLVKNAPHLVGAGGASRSPGHFAELVLNAFADCARAKLFWVTRFIEYADDSSAQELLIGRGLREPSQ
jgi:hypothetical protein